MPAVTSGKVLVTGANGYIAVWVVKSFLDQGFSVRGAVRSENKAIHLRSLFKSFGGKFEVAIVEDITKVRKPLTLPASRKRCVGERGMKESLRFLCMLRVRFSGSFPLEQRICTEPEELSCCALLAHSTIHRLVRVCIWLYRS